MEYQKRQAYRDYTHLESHLEGVRKNLVEGFNEDPPCKKCPKVINNDRTDVMLVQLDLSLNIVKEAIKREEGAKRGTDVHIVQKNRFLGFISGIIHRIKCNVSRNV